ncbi:MAG: NAD-binding protein [Beijerinckiaceae bacterium]
MPAVLASPLRNLLLGALVLLLIGSVATLAYTLQGWAVGDAIYMVVITVFSVGYREVLPVETPALRAITMSLIVAGCMDMVFITGCFVQLITASQFHQFFGIRRMQKDIDRLSGHVIICGFGRIGQMLARELKAGISSFVVIDNVDGQIALAHANAYLVLQGDARDEQILELAGIRRARAIATVLPDDAANVFITLSARALNPGMTIIARGELPSTETKLLQAGADRVVLPARIGAERMAELLLYKDMSGLITGMKGGNLDRLAAELQHLGLDIEIVAAEKGSRCVGAAISEIEARGSGAFLVVAIERRNGETILQPQDGVRVEEGDGVAVVCRPGRAHALEQIFAAPKIAEGAA